MAGIPGAFTTDNIPTSILYTEIMDSIELHNERERNFKSLFCGTQVGRKSTIKLREGGPRMEESGQDTTVPDMQHVPRASVSLNDPRRWLLDMSITHKAWEEGMDSNEVRASGMSAIDADFRVVQEAVLQEALTDGGWYDGTVVPPTYKSNDFTVNHDHYLAADVGGTPTLAHFTAAERHIVEHGYSSNDIVAFIHGANMQAIVENAEWATAPGPMPTPVMERLQEQGAYPGFMAAGTPVYTEDWVPENYMLITALTPGILPMYWRVPEGPGAGPEGAETSGGVEDLITYTMESNDSQMNIVYYWIARYARWTSATIIRKGAGVSYYLDGANWEDTSGWFE